MGIFVKDRLFAAVILSILIFGGCGRNKEQNIIPESELPASEQEQIRQVLRDNNYMKDSARDTFAEKYGAEGIPFMIERILEIYDLGSDFNYPAEYSIASNLILSLGEIGDNRVFPALKLWLTDKKYRVFRQCAAYSLGELGNPEASGPLRKIWEEEKGYLEKGDDEGPWPFGGYHPSGGYVHGVMGAAGTALFKLGEKSIVGNLIEIARISEDRWSSGTMKILRTLRELTGQSGLAATSRVQYWENWWNKNKQYYQ
ncbi:MAG: HEAT repeat domain-containing protein [Candidatus Omnitrophica bacterium]|nr:HEAT repeat domain-containing protein [Candidatus Omnitrophota bacterium]